MYLDLRLSLKQEIAQKQRAAISSRSSIGHERRAADIEQKSRYTDTMSILKPHECRVLGVLIEKAQTTPAQYPLSLNGLITGCNQKSNREPVVSLSEDDVLETVDGLRAKGLLREVMLSSSRVQKFRHVARETMDVSTRELVILAELMLRGPQTLGELRTRASRMHPLESTEVVQNILNQLMQRDEPMARQLPPAPGSRAPRFVQLLCPDLHPLNAPAAISNPSSPRPADSPDLLRRIESLETEVAELQRAFRVLSEAHDRNTETG